MPQKPRNKTDGQKVEFRWRQHEDEHRRRLAELAEEARREPNEHARELLKAALAGSEELLLDVHMLRQEVSELKDLLGGVGQQTQSHPAQTEIEYPDADRLDEVESRLLEQLHELGERQLDTREDIVNCTLKLLIEIGGVAPEQARDWAAGILGDQP